MRTADLIARYPNTHLDIHDCVRSFALRDNLAQRLRQFIRVQSDHTYVETLPALIHSRFKSDLAAQIPAYKQYPDTSTFYDIPYIEKAELRKNSIAYCSMKDGDLV